MNTNLSMKQVIVLLAVVAVSSFFAGYFARPAQPVQAQGIKFVPIMVERQIVDRMPATYIYSCPVQEEYKRCQSNCGVVGEEDLFMDPGVWKWENPVDDGNDPADSDDPTDSDNPDGNDPADNDDPTDGGNDPVDGGNDPIDNGDNPSDGKGHCNNGFGNGADDDCKQHGNARNQDEIGKHQDGKTPGGVKLLDDPKHNK